MGATRGRPVGAAERRQIAALVKAGRPIAEIAKKLGRPHATILFHVPEHLRSGTSKETVYIEQRSLSLPIDTWSGLDLDAEQRGITTTVYLRKMLGVIVRDALANAILDDQSDAQPKASEARV